MTTKEAAQASTECTPGRIYCRITAVVGNGGPPICIETCYDTYTLIFCKTFSYVC